MKKPKKNWLEWTVFALSLLLILATAGALVYEQVSLGKEPADPQIELGTPQPHAGYFAVPVRVTNQGDATAENVHLEVELQLPGGEKETGEFDLPYLPRHATREAFVTFRHNPSEGKMESRVLGYEKP